MSEPGRTADRNERLHAFSHDLKNRLGALWEAFLMARDLPPGPERDEVMAMAERSFFGGLRQVEALMDDLNVPRGPMRVERLPLDLVELVRSCAAHVAFLLQKKDQQVRIDASGPIMVAGDARLLEQLIDALLSNAVKFSPPGARLHVQVVLHGNEAEVRVTDPGVGLSAPDLARVFERYVILASRSTAGERQARGTLARARMWATAHGGTLEAASPGEGQGSTFILRLPLLA